MYPGIVTEIGEHGVVNTVIDTACAVSAIDPACPGCRSTVIDRLLYILAPGRDDTHIRVVHGYLLAARPTQDQVDAVHAAELDRKEP